MQNKTSQSYQGRCHQTQNTYDRWVFLPVYTQMTGRSNRRHHKPRATGWPRLPGARFTCGRSCCLPCFRFKSHPVISRLRSDRSVAGTSVAAAPGLLEVKWWLRKHTEEPLGMSCGLGQTPGERDGGIESVFVLQWEGTSCFSSVSQKDGQGPPPPLRCLAAKQLWQKCWAQGNTRWCQGCTEWTSTLLPPLSPPLLILPLIVRSCNTTLSEKGTCVRCSVSKKLQIITNPNELSHQVALEGAGASTVAVNKVRKSTFNCVHSPDSDFLAYFLLWPLIMRMKTSSRMKMRPTKATTTRNHHSS